MMQMTKYLFAFTTDEVLVRAEQLAMSARTLDELQRAQTVLLTMRHKLTLHEAAKVIGRSPSWVSHARRIFLENGVTSRSTTHGGRRNQILSETEEVTFMEEACKRSWDLMTWKIRPAEPGDGQIHRVVRKMLEERTGRPIPNSTAFALMSRVGKRKFKDYRATRWAKYTRDKFLP